MTTDARARFTLRIPTELMERMQEQADRAGVSVNAYILQILWDWVKEEKRC